ncbi:metallopeptidase TldD-related protein [Allostreptomyces psammosilenae]|uniref:Putative Zn-dependent protease n=1 Tax=Allostreptomyces psammosilenae TaxID=1892865 RepID=A0A852ZPC5_9ACTN|nr:metallopeptidase TldD-related protein [Allostreptomyces psammosilenae]NYI03327.1 putative Zn-dependent protease [Allostreptomyces psammosilenae]
MSSTTGTTTGPAASRTAPHLLVERALELSRADGCVVLVEESSTANLRWAGNALTTGGTTRGRTVRVIATVDGAEGTAAGVVAREAVTTDELQSLVRAAEQAARAASPAEDARPLVDATAASPDFDAEPAGTSADVFGSFAPALGEAFRRARATGQLLYGFAHHRVTTTYLGSSTGLRLRHDQPTGTLEVNAKSADLVRSAWHGVSTRDFADVDLPAIHGHLDERLGWAERRLELPAGRYETILPPSAVADLMVYLMWSAGARDAAEGRSVFSRPGGGTRVGERLTDVPLTLRSDPLAAGLECAPFVITGSSGDDESVFDNGLPVGATEWISEGVLSSLVSSRHSAEAAGLPVHPSADNLLLEVPAGSRTGNGDLAQLIGSTERGLLLTCLWYIREVDPATLLLTGLTRDGVYLVEGGEVVGAVNNFRFNESPVALLGRISGAGRTERTLPREWCDWFTRAAMPALRVDGFNMSSVSQAS